MHNNSFIATVHGIEYYELCSYGLRIKYASLKISCYNLARHLIFLTSQAQETKETKMSRACGHGFSQTWFIQVNLFQKDLFLHQLTNNMTKDCSFNYKFSTWKLKAQNMEKHEESMLCTKHVLLMFWARNFHVHTTYWISSWSWLFQDFSFQKFSTILIKLVKCILKNICT